MNPVDPKELTQTRFKILNDHCKTFGAIPEVLFAKIEGKKGLLFLGSPLSIEMIMQLRVLLDAKERELKGLPANEDAG